MAKNVEDTGARVRMLLGLEGSGPQKGDKAGAFLWAALSDLWTYSANRIPEISDTVVEADIKYPTDGYQNANDIQRLLGNMENDGKTGAHNVYANNLVFQNSTYNYSLKNGLTASGTVSANPMFVGYAKTGTPNLHLSSSSPAIAFCKP